MNRPRPPLTFRQEWRAAWRPGTVALVAGAICWQMWVTVSSIFVAPLQAAHGWTRGEIAYGYSLVLFCAFMAPLIGRTMDSVGVRRVLLIGITVMGVGYVLLASMGDSLLVFYAIYVLFALAGVSTTGMSFTRIINANFRFNRGAALAASRMGVAVTATVAPLLIFGIVSTYGFQAGYLLLGFLLATVAFPLVFFWAPRPDRNASDLLSEATTRSRPDSWGVLLRQPRVLLLCLAAGLNYGPVLAMLMHFQPMGISKGLSPDVAIGAVSMIGIATICGTLLSGFLVDRIWAPVVACVLNLLPAFGCILLSQVDASPMAVYFCALMIGIGQGAENDLVAFMIARYFGMRNYGAIYGMGVVVMGVMNASGNAFTGWSYDRYGSYNPGLIAAGLSFLLAAICYLAMGPYPARTADTVPDGVPGSTPGLV